MTDIEAYCVCEVGILPLFIHSFSTAGGMRVLHNLDKLTAGCAYGHWSELWSCVRALAHLTPTSILIMNTTYPSLQLCGSMHH